MALHLWGFYMILLLFLCVVQSFLQRNHVVQFTWDITIAYLSFIKILSIYYLQCQTFSLKMCLFVCLFINPLVPLINSMLHFADMYVIILNWQKMIPAIMIKNALVIEKGSTCIVGMIGMAFYLSFSLLYSHVLY